MFCPFSPKVPGPHVPVLISWALWVFQMQLRNLKIQSYIHKWEKTTRVCIFVSMLTHSTWLFPSLWGGIYSWHCYWGLDYLLNISLDYLLNIEPNATVLGIKMTWPLMIYYYPHRSVHLPTLIREVSFFNRWKHKDTNQVNMQRLRLWSSQS